MPTATGIFTSEETEDQYSFSYHLAKWIGNYLPKETRIIDFGCGNGTYISYLYDKGFGVTGVDGEMSSSYEGQGLFIKQDLTDQFTLDYKGNVICLEVGEHIPKEFEHIFFENITKHCTDKLILSFAVRGQGGLGHVNCKENIEVCAIMKDYGFKFLYGPTVEARKSITKNHCEWFKKSLLIFERI